MEDDFEEHQQAKKIKLDAIVRRIQEQVDAQESTEDGISVVDDRESSRSLAQSPEPSPSHGSPNSNPQSQRLDEASVTEAASPAQEEEDDLSSQEPSTSAQVMNENGAQNSNGLFQQGGASNEWRELTRSLGLHGRITLGNVNLEIHKVRIARHTEHSIDETQFQIRVQPNDGHEPLLSSVEGGIILALRKILDHLKASYPRQDYYGK